MNHLTCTIASLALLFFGSQSGKAETSLKKYAARLTTPEGYVCYRAGQHMTIDGQATETAWQKAPWTSLFTDIEGSSRPQPRYATRAKMLWDDNYLYIYAEMEEPHVWATIKERDKIIWYNNDFEVFIDPDGDGRNYFEIENNAYDTVFDLFLTGPYRSPIRPFILFDWNCNGLQLKSHINGTLNDPSDTDKGWSVEMAIPQKALEREGNKWLVSGKYLRLNFSRVQWQHTINKDGQYERKKDSNGKLLPENNWVWSPTGKIDMHMPERWGFVYLSPKVAGTTNETFSYPPYEAVRKLLWAMFYIQQDRLADKQSYFRGTEQFGLTPKDMNGIPQGTKIRTEATTNKFEITATLSDGTYFSLDESGQFLMSSPTTK